MSKKLALYILVLLSAFALSAADMSLYDYSDSTYAMVDKLTRLAGVIGPSSSTPVTGEELYIALKRVNPDTLPERYKYEYERLIKKFSENHDDFRVDGTIYFAPQVYLTVDQDSIDPKNFFIPFDKRLPAAYGELSLTYGNSLFLETSLEAINNSVIQDRNGLPYTSFDFIMSNRAKDGAWYVVSTKNPIQLYGEVPSMARGALGNNWFSFIFGRSHHQMGSGYSGNMLIGDNYRFQEIAKLTAQSNPFTYTMDFTHFDPQEILNNDGGYEINKEHFDGPQVLRLVHRFDVNICNRARIALNMGFVMYGSNLADLRLITPLFAVHNWYNFREGQIIKSGDEANNILSVEAEWMVIPRLKLGLQVVVDQWQMFWENDDVPDAWGLLWNASYLQTFKQGDVEYYAEGVYTAPNLYLNTKYNSDGTRNYNYDFALGYFGRDTTGDVAWSGHNWGPNSLGLIAGAKINLYDYKLKVDSSIAFHSHGDIPYETPYFEKGIYQWIGTPEHKMDMKVEAGWSFFKGLELLGGVNFGFYWNFNHVNKSFKFMPQGMIGLKYTVI